MKCTDPNYALILHKEEDFPFINGKYHIKFLGHSPNHKVAYYLERYGSDQIIPVPCGHCLACRTNYVKDWSVRCMLEASMYKDNYFVTLTYDDDHITKACRKDFKQFLDRLDYYLPGVRFFACFEKGETTGRGHFHAILFNCPIPDLKFIGRRDGNPVYESDLIKKCWRNGLIDIGDVSMASCQYVAGYVMKKLRKKDDDEYVMMSTHPGLGYDYFQKHFDVIYDTDGIYLSGKKCKVPRYFDKLLDRVSPDTFRSVKYNRLKDVSSGVIADLLVHGLINLTDLNDYNRRVYVNQMKDKLNKRSAI